MSVTTLKQGEPGVPVSLENVSLGDAEFARVRDLVKQLAGIVIKEQKREMIQSRLTRRLRALNMTCFKAYVDFLESPAGANEISEFTNVVTTNLTSFFRESHHFDHLRDVILASTDGFCLGDRVRIWSSACSSGEEPYSIAMTVRSSPEARRSDVRILATDLDTNMLDRARRGVYPQDRIAPIPQEMARKHLARQGDDHALVADVKGMITFNQLNLMHEWPVRGPFDAIFCRNVLIYFDSDTKRRIVDRMASLLRPHGALYLGHSESLLGEHPLLRSEGRTIYRRKA